MAGWQEEIYTISVSTMRFKLKWLLQKNSAAEKNMFASVIEKKQICFLKWQKAAFLTRKNRIQLHAGFLKAANNVKQWFIFGAALSRPLICSIYFVMSQLDLDYKRAGKFN